jgi:hypothetical protein
MCRTAMCYGYKNVINTLPSRALQACLQHLHESRVLQCCGNTLFVIKLFIDYGYARGIKSLSPAPGHNEITPTCVLTLVRTGFDADIHFEPGWQCAKQADADRQSDKGGHATMGYGRGELDEYAARSYLDLRRRDDRQLLQCHRAVLRVAD